MDIFPEHQNPAQQPALVLPVMMASSILSVCYVAPRKVATSQYGNNMTTSSQKEVCYPGAILSILPNLFEIGTSACIFASRLSENHDTIVLLIEAGPKYTHLSAICPSHTSDELYNRGPLFEFTKPPLMWTENFRTSIAWSYSSSYVEQD